MLFLEVPATWGAVLRASSIRKLESYCSKVIGLSESSGGWTGPFLIPCVGNTGCNWPHADHSKYYGTGTWTRKYFAVVLYSRQLAIIFCSSLGTDSHSTNGCDLGSCVVITHSQNELPLGQKLLACFTVVQLRKPGSKIHYRTMPIQRNYIENYTENSEAFVQLSIPIGPEPDILLALILFVYFETGFYYVVLASLELTI